MLLWALVASCKAIDEIDGHQQPLLAADHDYVVDINI